MKSVTVLFATLIMSASLFGLKVNAFTYSCAGAGCSINPNGCSANPLTGQSGCSCYQNGGEIVCTKPSNNRHSQNGDGYDLPKGSTSYENVSTITNPIGINSFCGFIKTVLTGVLAIGIPIAVLFIVFAGFKFPLAFGDPDALNRARSNLMYTLFGIGLFLGSWLMAQVIANVVSSLQTPSSQPTSSCS